MKTENPEAPRVKMLLQVEPSTREWLWRVASRYGCRLGSALDRLAEGDRPGVEERLSRLERMMQEHLPEVAEELNAPVDLTQPNVSRTRYDHAKIIALIPPEGLTFGNWLRAAKVLYPRIGSAVMSRILQRMATAKTHKKVEGRIMLRQPEAAVVDV